jgi:aminoglycoside 6'-N-acetyltransferase I
MTALFALGRNLGCKTAWVATEVDNVAARGLYAAVGGQEEISVVYTFDL